MTTDNTQPDQPTAGPSCSAKCPCSCSPDTNYIKTRAMAMLFEPKTVWEQIKSDSKSIPEIYQSYLFWLAALSAICSFLGMTIIGISIPLAGKFRWPFFSGLVWQVVNLGFMLVMFFVLAKVAKFLAPKFEGSLTDLQAFQAIAYGITPALVGGVLSLVPFGLFYLVQFGLGIYSLYLIYQGFKALGTIPAARSKTFFGAFIFCSFIVGVFCSVPLSMLAPTPPMPDLADFNVNAGEFGKSMEHLQKALKNPQ